MKRLLVIISITAAVLLILAGAGYFVWSNLFPPEPPSPGATQATPPPPPKEEEGKTPTEQPAPGLDEKIEDFIKAIADVSATGESKEVTLVFTEAEVNDQAAMLLAQVEIPEDIPLEVKSVHIDFQTDNNLVTEAETTTYVLGATVGVTIKVKTQVGVKEGKPDVEITDVSFGFIPLPETLKDRIVAVITQKIDELLVQLTETGIGGNGKVDLEFKDINVQEEEMTITVIIKPKE